MSVRRHPPALPHGELAELFPDVFFVTGSMSMPGPLPVRFSRNMSIIREGGRLVLVNSVRLDDDGLRALDALGRVTDVVRLAGFHGKDDAFYKERYGATVWALAGQRYVSGFDLSAASYFEADRTLVTGGALPLAGARLHVIASQPGEGLLLIESQGGILVAGDALQNWAEPDRFFSFVGKLMLRRFGFIKPHQLGPAWLKRAKPPLADLRQILELPFEHVLPAHGAPVRGAAKERYRPAIEGL
jgi:hypothetical protein